MQMTTIQSANFLSGVVQISLLHAIILRATKTPYLWRRVIESAILLSFSFTLLSGFPGALYLNYTHLLLFNWTFLNYLSYRFLFRVSRTQSVSFALGQLVLSQCVEYVYQLALALLRGRFAYDIENLAHAVIVKSFVLLILIILYFIVRTFDFPIFWTTDDKSGHWAISFLFLILFTGPNITRLERQQINEIVIRASTIDLYNIFFFFAFFVYNTFYIRNLKKLSDSAIRLEFQQLHSVTQERSLRKVQGFKHDFANIINTINGLVEIEDWAELKHYMSGLGTDFLLINNTDVVNLHLKSSPILYVVVMRKMELAELMGVEFRILIQREIKLSYCNPADFSRIMGILLDNALEAATVAGKKLIELEVEWSRGRNKIFIRNSCAGPVDTTQIFQEGYTTKESHSGIGLSTAMSIIEQYRRKGFDMKLGGVYQNHVFTQMFIE